MCKLGTSIHLFSSSAVIRSVHPIIPEITGINKKVEFLGSYYYVSEPKDGIQGTIFRKLTQLNNELRDRYENKL